MKDMILAASITLLTLVNCAQSLMLLPQIEAPIYDLKLSQDLLFQWQVDYQKEEIYVQVSLLRHHGRGKLETFLIIISELLINSS